MSNEISTFLSKKPLKMAASTIYSIQKLRDNGSADDILSEYDHIRDLIDIDVRFLEGYYPPSLDLIPEKYRDLTESLLTNCVEKMSEIEKFENFEIESSTSNN